MTKLRCSVSLALLMLSTGACVDGGESDTSEDDELFYETVVEVRADGTMVIGEPVEVTGDMRLTAYVGFSPVSGVPLVEDPSCRDASFWLFTRSDWTGSRICFLGGDLAKLSDYARYARISGEPVRVGSWALQYGSFLAGSQGGYISGRGWEISFGANEMGVLAQPTKAETLFIVPAATPPLP